MIRHVGRQAAWKRHGFGRALDGPLAPIGCASRTRSRPCDDCTDVATCRVCLLMTEVRDLSAKLLDDTSIAEMKQLAERWEPDPNDRI